MDVDKNGYVYYMAWLNERIQSTGCDACKIAHIVIIIYNRTFRLLLCADNATHIGWLAARRAICNSNTYTQNTFEQGHFIYHYVSVFAYWQITKCNAVYACVSAPIHHHIITIKRSLIWTNRCDARAALTAIINWVRNDDDDDDDGEFRHFRRRCHNETV